MRLLVGCAGSIFGAVERRVDSRAAFPTLARLAILGTLMVALNEVAPGVAENGDAKHDWAKLLRERVAATSTHAPLGGIELGGWKLVYNDQPNALTAAAEKLEKFADFSYSLGFNVGENGDFFDVIVGSPAHAAGLGPGMKLIAVNGRKYSPPVLHAALKAAQGNTQPIELLVENAQYFKTYSVPYHGGDRNPHLERVADKPDFLGDNLKPLTK